MNGMLDRILDSIHPGINKDPQKMDAIRITGDGTVLIDDGIMQLINSSQSIQFNLTTHTLGSLTTEINNVSGFSAVNLQSSKLSALVLIEGEYETPTTLTMFTSFLWQILKPVAVALLTALNADNDALLEMILNTSDGAWLDDFGELFDVSREINEPDQLYAIRIFNLSVGVRANNFAIQKALQDLQYNATVIDSESDTSFEVDVLLPTAPPKGFVYSLAQLGNIVDKLRPAGVSYLIQTKSSIADMIIIEDAYSITKSTGSVKYGSGRKWGQGIWGK